MLCLCVSVCVCVCLCGCVCVCNQRNAKVVAMVVFFQQCTYSIHGLHFFFGIAWLLIINVQIAHGFQFSIQNTQVHVYCCNTFHLIL